MIYLQPTNISSKKKFLLFWIEFPKFQQTNTQINNNEQWNKTWLQKATRNRRRNNNNSNKKCFLGLTSWVYNKFPSIKSFAVIKWSMGQAFTLNCGLKNKPLRLDIILQNILKCIKTLGFTLSLSLSPFSLCLLFCVNEMKL